MKIMVTSDWELTEDRLPIAEKAIAAMLKEFEEGDYTHFVFCGDMFREFTAATGKFARETIEWIGDLTNNTPEPVLLVGNHDRETTEDRITALFGHSIAVPKTGHFNGTPVAFLPAPNRAVFGATRGAEGKRARDAAISEALEAALISLETQIGPENLGKAILFNHCTIVGADMGSMKIPPGFTWQIDAARLQRWGLVVSGHIHFPGQIGDNIFNVGGIFPQTHGEKADTFRVLCIEDTGRAVHSIPLPRVLVPIEVELGPHEEAIWPGYGKPLEAEVVEYLRRKANLDTAADTVNLKIRAKLPPNELDALPGAETLKAAINKHFGRELIHELKICREPQGLHKARLEGDVRKMQLAEQFDAWLVAMEIDADGPTVEQAKTFLSELGVGDLLSGGKFGYKPLWTRVHNFCQWADAHIDYSMLEGAVSVSGMNKLGKSNLFIKAAEFALYKTTGPTPLEFDLRKGKTEGHVEHCYIASGKTYLVRRSMERGKGGVTCKSELFEFIDGIDGTRGLDVKSVKPVTEKATDIDRYIEDTVGSRPFFLSTVIGSQGDTERIINATPADWDKWLAEALGLERFEPYRKDAQKRADGAKSDVEKTETRIDELDGQIVSEEAELEDMTDAESINQSIALNQGYHDGSKAAKKVHEETAQALQVKIAGLNDKLADGPGLNEELEEVEKSLIVLSLSDAEDIGPRPEPIVFEGSVEEAKGKLDRLRATRDTLDDELSKLRTRHAELGGNIASHATAKAELVKKGVRLQGQIEELEAKPLEVPPCEELLDEDPDAPKVRDTCPAWRAYSNGEHIEQMELERVAVEVEATTISKNLVTMKEQHEQFAADILEKRKLEQATVDQVADLSQRIGDYENVEKAIELWDVKARGVEAEKVREAELKQKRVGLQEKIKALVQYVDDRALLQTELVELRPKITTLTADIEKYEREIHLLYAKLDARKLIEAAIAKKRTRQKELRGEIAGGLLDSQAWGLVALSLHHNTGIPYMLLEQMIGGFEREVNRILEPADMSITIQTITPTQKGEARDKLTVWLNDERGQHPLAKASGMQRQPLVMAIRTGFSIVGSHFYGNMPEIYLQDEGFGAFHSSMYDVAREMIAVIAERFRTFVYITHTSLADSADIKLQIVEAGDSSRVVGLTTYEEIEERVAS